MRMIEDKFNGCLKGKVSASGTMIIMAEIVI